MKILFYYHGYLSVCLAGPHQKRLLHHLLDAYIAIERPVANESDSIKLSLGLSLMQILEVVSRSERGRIM